MDAVIGGEAHALSGGEERRLDLARTLWRQGSLVMLDEPTAGLDEKRASSWKSRSRSCRATS